MTRSMQINDWFKNLPHIWILCVVFAIGFATGGSYIYFHVEEALHSPYKFESWKDGYIDAINGFNYSYPYYPDDDFEIKVYQKYYNAGYWSGYCDDWNVQYFNISVRNVERNSRNTSDSIFTTDNTEYIIYNSQNNYQKLNPGSNYTIGLIVWHPNSTHPEIDNEICSIKEQFER